MKQTLSILIPVYNEEATVLSLLRKVVAVDDTFFDKEIIVVNDCSTDASEKKIQQFIEENPQAIVKYLKHEKNAGKGAAIRTAIAAITGEVSIVQDADLEYEPDDYVLMYQYYINYNLKVVYGSRFLKSDNTHSYSRFYWGGRLVTWVSNILYRQHLTDEPTCYKMIDSQLLKSLGLVCNGFEFCPEVTAKIAKKGILIQEIPIRYYPRKIEEGKKIKWYDGLEAIWTLGKYKFTK